MFTGIVEETGEVLDLRLGAGGESARLAVRGPVVTADAVPGASIAVNGVCLTVTEHEDGEFSVDVMGETLARSSLGRLRAGDRVNLERPTAVGGRLGGHIVQGHVDAVGEVLDRRTGDRWEVVRVALPASVERYVVEKGSIAVDGVSLTVSAVGPGWFEVSLVPTTLAATTLGRSPVGTTVNLEVDVIAKYVERLLRDRAGSG